MHGRGMEERLPHKGLRQQEFDFLLLPVVCGDILQEQHDLLELHPHQLCRPFRQESRADVQVEFREPMWMFRL